MGNPQTVQGPEIGLSGISSVQGQESDREGKLGTGGLGRCRNVYGVWSTVTGIYAFH